MTTHSFVLSAILCVPFAWGQCDLKDYKRVDGLSVEMREGTLEVLWTGERGEQLKAGFIIRNGQPLISDLEARKNGGKWVTLGKDLVPEFEVTSGKRRLSEQQMAPLRALGIALTPEVVEREKWFAFWDAPLMIPGAPKTNLDLPRLAEEVKHASASYQAIGCRVKSDGARVEITYPGLTMGIFSGDLQFTIYRRIEPAAR